MLRVAPILTPIEPGGAGGPALTQALFLADRLQAPLHLVHVRLSAEADDDVESASDSIQRLIHDHVRRTPFPGADPQPTLHPAAIHAASVAEGLLSYATHHDIRLIVAGPHPDRGPVPALKSSVIDALVRQTSIPILAIGASTSLPSTRFQRILVPVDFSSSARRALAHAKEWAALYDARLDVLHVLERPQYIALNATDMLSLSDPTLPQRKARRRLETFCAETEGSDVSLHLHLAQGDAADQIGAFAHDHGNDLIVLSSHGRTSEPSHALGSVAEKVLRRVSVPTFVMKTFGPSLLEADARPASEQDPQ